MDDAAPGKTARPHHSGHRERLRERARKGGLEALPDYELLELYLFRSIPLRDVKPLAKALLARFGGLGGVLGASIEELRTVSGVGESVALDLKLMHEAALRIGREPVTKRTVISSWSALLAYVKVALAHEAREQFRVLFLDRKSGSERLDDSDRIILAVRHYLALKVVQTQKNRISLRHA